jgi:hypothetical protein
VQNGNKVMYQNYDENFINQLDEKNSTMLMLHFNQTQNTIDLNSLQNNKEKDINSALEEYFRSRFG